MLPVRMIYLSGILVMAFRPRPSAGICASFRPNFPSTTVVADSLVTLNFTIDNECKDTAVDVVKVLVKRPGTPEQASCQVTHVGGSCTHASGCTCSPQSQVYTFQRNPGPKREVWTLFGQMKNGLIFEGEVEINVLCAYLKPSFTTKTVTEDTDVTMSFTFVNICQDDNNTLTTALVSVKNGDSLQHICQVQRARGTCGGFSGCTCDRRSQVYSVTRRVKGQRGEVWKLSGQSPGGGRFQQEIEIDIEKSSPIPSGASSEPSVTTTMAEITLNGKGTGSVTQEDISEGTVTAVTAREGTTDGEEISTTQVTGYTDSDSLLKETDTIQMSQHDFLLAVTGITFLIILMLTIILCFVWKRRDCFRATSGTQNARQETENVHVVFRSLPPVPQNVQEPRDSLLSQTSNTYCEIPDRTQQPSGGRGGKSSDLSRISDISDDYLHPVSSVLRQSTGGNRSAASVASGRYYQNIPTGV